MCLYPKLVDNPRYKKNAKNGGIIPPIRDKRHKYVPVACGNCLECRKSKANEWRIRLIEDLKVNRNGYFVTLTFDNESLCNLSKDVKKDMNVEGYELDNEICKLAVRRFLGRWKKKNKKSVRHWLITELGTNRTERVHLHGIIWTDIPEEINNKWGYGFTDLGKYVNSKTASYIVKYLHKVDEKHKHYKPVILTSPGIGKAYLNSNKAKNHKNGEYQDYYVFDNGRKAKLPLYYRNHIFNENERENLWSKMLDEEKRYVLGKEIDISKGDQKYWDRVNEARRINKELGYRTKDDTEEEWSRKQYEKQRRRLKHQEQRIREIKS